jgi:hypothetical protein
MSLQGQKQSLEVLEKLQAPIAIKLRQLARAKRLLEAEISTIEELIKKKRRRESLVMQTHLASEATTRIKGLLQRAQQIAQASWALLNEELEKANQRYYSRSQFIQGSLLPTEEASLGQPVASLRLKSRQQFIEALHQHERHEAILKWVGESPKTIENWKAQQRPTFESYIENDPQRDSILTAGSQPLKIDDKDLKAAKERYLCLLGEVTLLLEELRELENASATSQAEREQIDRHAKAESLRLSKTYARNLFNGYSELVAYQEAAATLEGARAMHAKRLDAMREKSLGLKKAQIDEVLASAALSPEVAQGFRERTEQAFANRDSDALAQIRRELAELTDLIEQSKGNPQIAKFFESHGHSSITVINGAAALAPGPGPVASEAAKGRGFSIEWGETLHPDRDNAQQEQGQRHRR